MVFEYRDRRVWNIECPNLFKLGSKWVLLISPENPCEYFVGSLDLARGKFTPDTHGVLDPGRSYASNISYDDRGRTLLWLWGRTDSDPAKGWQCCMTMPRVLSIDDDGFLRQNPAPEFETLRGDVRSMNAAPLDPKPLPLGDAFAGDSMEIEAAFTLEQAAAVGIRVRISGAGKAAGRDRLHAGQRIAFRGRRQRSHRPPEASPYACLSRQGSRRGLRQRGCRGDLRAPASRPG